LLSDFTGLLFPELCIACGNRLLSQEKYLCLDCWIDLPVTNFHFNRDNKVAQLFWGRSVIENATSWFSYKKGSNYQQLIHYIKYKGLKELGTETGRKFATSLSVSDFIKGVDMVVPVPLHPKKKKKRGFNQSEYIARGMAEVLKIPLSVDNLHRIAFTSTQTNKNRFERWKNVEGIFGVHHPEEFTGNHLLLVDDVVTTGSTLEACAGHILTIPGTKVSIATLAFADY
jgi:ComF family protein